MGSIPACTGKPVGYSLPLYHLRVYPRVYGETLRDREATYTAEGLSRVYGKPGVRLTRTAYTRVYPRVYGETPPQFDARSRR